MARAIHIPDPEVDSIVHNGRSYVAIDDLVAMLNSVLAAVPRRGAAGRSIHNIVGDLRVGLVELDRETLDASFHERIIDVARRAAGL